MPRFAKFFTYERRIIGTALVAVVPLAAAAALLVASGDFAPIVSWTVTLLIVATLIVATFALHEVIAYPLRTLANVVSAVRDEDYSLRAREAAEGAVFGEVLLELNDLSAALRDRRLAAVEAVALVRGVMEEVDAGIFAFDPSSRLELVNRAGEHLLRESSPRLLGRTAAELGLADLLDGAEGGTVERNFGGLTARWNVRVSTFRREGEMHRLLVIADISRALRQEEIRAWQRLVRVLGHELNNSLAPIRSIAGSLQDLVAREERPDDWLEDVQRGLAVIESRSAGLSRFMEAYAKLTRLPRPVKRKVAIADLVQRVARVEQRMAVHIEPGPPLTVEVDADQIEQLLINLTRNAVDASLEASGAEVSLAWTADERQLELAVTDDGNGISGTTNLFVPFFTTKSGGSGVGLALSRMIAESHGGTLTLENRGAGGRGAIARLRLPR
jgi:nitrogen fixation/metabolism regulation signal transduction histidine kinase